MLEMRNKDATAQEVERYGDGSEQADSGAVIPINAYLQTEDLEAEIGDDTRQAARTRRPKKKKFEKAVRFNLTIPEGLYKELEALAAEHHTTELDLMRTALRLAILGLRAQRVPGDGLVLSTQGTERLLLLP